MDNIKTTLECAFELAKSGKYHSVSELRTAIKRERYVVAQIDRPALGRQLRHLIHKTAHPLPKAG